MNLTDNYRLLKAVSFAADKHRFQTRKDKAGTPYINHPIKVALTLMEAGGETDETLLIAAILHDTIEDTNTEPEEIEQLFGKSVLGIVAEVTDDKTLSKEERKRLQVVNASSKSLQARKLKLADKICNVYDIIHNPPDHWSLSRKLEYLAWAEQVLKGLKGANDSLEKELERLIQHGRSIFLSDAPHVNVA